MKGFFRVEREMKQDLYPPKDETLKKVAAFPYGVPSCGK